MRVGRSFAVALVAVLALTGAGRADDKADPRYGFTEDIDTGDKGDRSVEFDTFASFGKRGGSYRAVTHLISAKQTFIDNFETSQTAIVNHHRIRGVPDLDDRRESSFAGLAVQGKYRILERSQAPFGLAVAVAPVWLRTDTNSGARVESYGVGIVVAAEKELIAQRLFSAFNLLYGLKSARPLTGIWERSSLWGASGALTTPVGDVFIGGEVRVESAYDGLGLDRYAGHAVFVGPQINGKLGKNASYVAAWNSQVAGHAAGDPAALDLRNFERHRFRLKLDYAF
jgi:hypothetical protein